MRSLARCLPAFSFVACLAFLAAIGLPAVARAQRAHGAHEHGVAALTVAIDGQALLVELISPLDNLVGFERAPKNAAERAALAEAGRRLRDAGAMFALPPAAGCRLEAVDIESPWPLSAATPAPGSGGQPPAHDARGGHEDVVASYRFACVQPAALERLEVGAFAQFPRLRTLRVEHAGARGQGAAVLTPAAPGLAL